jgi:hypothetical protein
LILSIETTKGKARPSASLELSLIGNFLMLMRKAGR